MAFVNTYSRMQQNAERSRGLRGTDNRSCDRLALNVTTEFELRKFPSTVTATACVPGLMDVSRKVSLLITGQEQRMFSWRYPPD